MLARLMRIYIIKSALGWEIRFPLWIRLHFFLTFGLHSGVRFYECNGQNLMRTDFESVILLAYTILSAFMENSFKYAWNLSPYARMLIPQLRHLLEIPPSDIRHNPSVSDGSQNIEWPSLSHPFYFYSAFSVLSAFVSSLR